MKKADKKALKIVKYISFFYIIATFYLLGILQEDFVQLVLYFGLGVFFNLFAICDSWKENN